MFLSHKKDIYAIIKTDTKIQDLAQRKKKVKS